MVIMALDHTRDFFSNRSFEGDPERLADPGLALFLTRWVTHFCAPTFVFLAGTGAWLSLGRGKDPRSLARFLATRGLWLILLELTVVGFGWTFSFSLDAFVLQVIWVLGLSMLLLAVLVALRLPPAALAAVGVLLIVGHNALDALQPASGASIAWRLLHVPDTYDPAAAPSRFFVRYPLIPWPGVMCCGFAFGAVLQRSGEERRRVLLALGTGLVTAFVVLRLAGIYGDPRPFHARADLANTVISFLNTQKYPPSLEYLLMTLGPAILAVGLLEKARGPLADALVVFGRVPLFYYLLHVPLIHLLAIVGGLLRYGPSIAQATSIPKDWGWGLPVVYAVWALVVVALFPLCRWFAGVKARRRDLWWLGYL